MQRARSTRARLLTGALVLVLVGIGVIATLDAVRSAFRGGPSETRERTPALSASVPAAPADSSALLRHFRARGIAGVLVYSDPLDGCRLHALELPTLHDVAPPKLRACRFELPRVPGSGATPAGVTWHPGGRLAAGCRRGRVTVTTRTGNEVHSIGGCTPAWRPDGLLTLARAGAVRSVDLPCLRRKPRSGSCGGLALSRRDLRTAARLHPIVPPGRPRLGRAELVDLAWLGPTQAFAVIRFRLGGRLRQLGPQVAGALFEGRRALRVQPAPAGWAGANLRESPGRRLVAAVEPAGPASIFKRDGLPVESNQLPVASPLAIAWSPDERWTAVAGRDSVYLLRTAGLVAGGEPRALRLPLAVRDLAWVEPPCGAPEACRRRFARDLAVAAGFRVVSYNGSAWIVRTRHAGAYLWATDFVSRARLVSEGFRLERRVDGTEVFTDGVRAAWRAAGSTIWLEAGPGGASRRPEPGELELLVRAGRVLRAR